MMLAWPKWETPREITWTTSLQCACTAPERNVGTQPLTSYIMTVPQMVPIIVVWHMEEPSVGEARDINNYCTTHLIHSRSFCYYMTKVAMLVYNIIINYYYISLAPSIRQQINTAMIITKIIITEARVTPVVTRVLFKWSMVC